MPNESREDARRRITKELNDLERRSLELKKDWNTYAPICRIPDEIIVEIFEAVQTELRFPAWYRFLGVCSHLRNVAVGAPTLWSEPPTKIYDLTMLMLERSKVVPLDVIINECTLSETVDQFSDHIERIRLLKIIQDITIGGSGRLLKSHQKFSRLAELSVFNIAPSTTRPLMPLWQSYSLRIIDFRYVSLDWNMFSLPNLVSLTLSHTTWTHRAGISAPQLLQTLTQMPYLELIHLDNVPIILPDISQLSNTVNLFFLTHLELWEVTAHVAEYLLTHMSLPLLQKISISCRYQPNEIHGDRGKTIQAFLSVVTQGRFGPLDSLLLEADDFVLQTSAKYPSYSSVWAICRFFISNNHQLHNGCTVLEELLHANSKYRILERFTLLNLHLAATFTASNLHALWNVTTLTQIIEVHADVLSTFTEALSTRPAPDVLLPKLESIFLAHFQREYHERYDPGTFKRFCDALILRRDYGVPLRTVSLASCELNEGDLDHLKAIVANVEII